MHTLDGEEEARGMSDSEDESECSPCLCGMSDSEEENEGSSQIVAKVVPDYQVSSRQTVFNVVKNIVGEGMLSLPFGISVGTGVVPGAIMTVLLAGLFGYTFSMMGRLCDNTGEKTHKGIGRVVSGRCLASLMAIVVMVKTMMSCLAFSTVIGHTFSHVFHHFGIDSSFTTPWSMVIVLTVGVVLPLSLQKDLSVLAYTSLVGIMGEVFTAVVMSIRLADGSYFPGGEFFNSTLPRYRPGWEDSEGIDWWSVRPEALLLFNTLATAYIAHYNAPKFYGQLKERSPERFNCVVFQSFSFAMLVYLWVMISGYLTFGRNCAGLILDNYSEQDELASLANFGMGMAVLFAYPLAFTGLRDSFMQVFSLDKDNLTCFNFVTIGLLSFVTLCACFGVSLGIINGLGGAIFGSLITLIFPALLCAISVDSGKSTVASAAEGHLNKAVVVAGVILATLGSYMSIATI